MYPLTITIKTAPLSYFDSSKKYNPNQTDILEVIYHIERNANQSTNKTTTVAPCVMFIAM